MTQLMFRIDELEGNKTKLQMRLQEAEETIDSLHTKVTLRYGLVESMLFVQVASTEKTKHRMDTELEDLQLEFERVNAAAIVADKRAQNFDKVIGEWKLKVEDLCSELEASQRECRCTFIFVGRAGQGAETKFTQELQFGGVPSTRLLGRDQRAA